MLVPRWHLVTKVLGLPRDESFDAALVTGHVLGYMPFTIAQAALTEVTRAVRRGGAVIVGVWMSEALGREHDGLIAVREGGPDGNERALHFFTAIELAALQRDYQLQDTLSLSRLGEFGTEYVVSCYRRN